MKIAYLMLAHRDPKHIKRISTLLSKTGDCYIHLDKKSERKSFLSEMGEIPGVKVLSKYRVSWAGWSMVKAYMFLLDYAFKNEKKYDRFVLMTGQDYPLMTDEEIIDEFTRNNNVEYVMAYNIATSTIPTDKNKILKKWYFDVPFKNNFLRKSYLRIMYRLITKPFTAKKLKVVYGGVEVDPYFGQMLSAFTRNSAELILNTYHHDKKYNRKMKTVHAAVESYWQTIIFNSHLRKNTIQNGEEHEITEHFGWAPLHYHSYDVYTSVYKEEDFEVLKNCGYMFCRKLIPGISDSLMDKIDEMRERKNLEVAETYCES